MTHLIDSEKLIAEIERRIEETKSMKPSFDQFWAGQISAFKGAIKIAESLQKEQPMPDSTKLIEFWNEDKEMLKERDFRDDAWRLAYNAFMCGFGRGISVKRRERSKGESWLETSKKELQHEEELLDMRLETLKHIRDKKNQFQQEQPEVELERELRDYFSKWDYDSYDGVITMDNGIVATLSSIQNVARHFYELGLNARKEG